MSWKGQKKRDFKDFKNKCLSAAKFNWSLTKDLAKPIGSWKHQYTVLKNRKQRRNRAWNLRIIQNQTSPRESKRFHNTSKSTVGLWVKASLLEVGNHYIFMNILWILQLWNSISIRVSQTWCAQLVNCCQGNVMHVILSKYKD